MKIKKYNDAAALLGELIHEHFLHMRVYGNIEKDAMKFKTTITLSDEQYRGINYFLAEMDRNNGENS
jgi:hypothetical protein